MFPSVELVALAMGVGLLVLCVQVVWVAARGVWAVAREVWWFWRHRRGVARYVAKGIRSRTRSN